MTTDAGNFGGWVARGFRFRRPGTFLGPTSGAMGYGLPAAIAAALVHRDRPVVAVAGDGGFAMTMAELETAVRERARVIALVFDNERYGTIRMHQDRRGAGHGVATDLGPIDFAAIAGPSARGASRVETDADVRARAPRGARGATARRSSTCRSTALGLPRPTGDVSGAAPASEACVPGPPRRSVADADSRGDDARPDRPVDGLDRHRPVHARGIPVARPRRHRDARRNAARPPRQPDRRRLARPAWADAPHRLDYLVALVALGLIAVLSLADALPAWLLIVITAVSSLTSILSVTGLAASSRSSSRTSLGAGQRDRLNGYVVATIFGPPLAAGLVTFFGGRWPFS